VQGTNFSSTCVVLWNGQQRPTQVASSTRAVATIAPADVAVPASVTINVLDTSTGTKSNSATFIVTSAPSPAIQHHALLSWIASGSPVIGYKVYRGTQSGGPYALLSTGSINAETFTDATVTSGQTYFYVVTAMSSAGLESAFSNEVAAVIPTP
jgi:fibronectin type 3 domain-containing protein